MKVSNKTKNMRQRFFRSTRRKLEGKFGPQSDPEPMSLAEFIRSTPHNALRVLVDSK